VVRKTAPAHRCCCCFLLSVQSELDFIAEHRAELKIGFLYKMLDSLEITVLWNRSIYSIQQSTLKKKRHYTPISGRLVTGQLADGKGYFAECGKLSKGNLRKMNADFFCGMKGKVRNETMQNVAETP